MTPAARRAHRRGALRLLVAALVAAGLVLTAAGPASAHAQLIGSDPVDGAVLSEAPDTVTLSFNESVKLTDRQITVYDAAGATVPSAATSSGTEVGIDLSDPDALEQGTYVVAWFVLSGDGHPISGSLSFSVGEPSDDVVAPPAAPTSSGVVVAAQGLLATLMYVGLLIAAGLAAFVALVLPRAFAGEQLRRRIRRLARVAAIVAAVAAVLLLPVSAAYAQGEELTGVLGGFDPGLVIDEIVSAGLLLIGLGIVATSLNDRPPGQRHRWALLLGATAAILSPAVVGHTRSYQPLALLVGSDIVHVAAGAVWLGGLVGLVLSLRALSGREELAATTLARFSTLAGGLLLAVAAAGTVLGWRILESWSAFVETGYGVLLLVKIGLALAVAAVGGWNRFGMLPRVRGAAGFADRERIGRLVTRTLRVEVTLILLLLGVTGFLVNQSPRPAPVEVAAGQTGIQEGSVGELEVFAAISPGDQGPNTLLVQLQDQAGEPVTPPRPPVVAVRSGEVDLGEVRLVNTDAGTYRADVVLPRPGTWEVQVGVRIDRFQSPVTTMTFEVTGTDRGQAALDTETGTGTVWR